jgi:hypothetical protein
MEPNESKNKVKIFFTNVVAKPLIFMFIWGNAIHHISKFYPDSSFSAFFSSLVITSVVFCLIF